MSSNDGGLPSIQHVRTLSAASFSVASSNVLGVLAVAIIVLFPTNQCTKKYTGLTQKFGFPALIR